jgi:peptidoglycan/LPS O-acetylase OafA/YrhL
LLLSLVQLMLHQQHPRLLSLLSFLGLGLLILPIPSFVRIGSIAVFPLNNPTWSIFFELVANVLHAVAFRCRSWRLLAIAGGLAALLSAIFTVHFGDMNLGAERPTLLYGFARVIADYVGGILVYRVWQQGRFRPHLPPLLLAVLLICVLAARVPSRFSAFYDILIVMLAFPPFLLVSASSPISQRMAPVATLLGRSSYAVYVLHQPIGRWFRWAWLMLVGRPAESSPPWPMVFNLIGVVIIALLVDRYYDEAMRAKLRDFLLPESSFRTKTGTMRGHES